MDTRIHGELDARSRDYLRVEQAIRFIESRRLQQPSLEDVAAAVHLSPHHFQRLFQRWAGISPKRFVQFLTKEHAIERLRASEPVLEAALAAGLSGAGRLHDLLVHCEAVTPGDVARGGAGIGIAWGFHPTPYGRCLLALTERGVCALRFVDAGQADDTLAELASKWPHARLLRDPGRTAAVAERIFAAGARRDRLALHLRGTNFQIKVWEALIAIPEGSVASYAAIAGAIGKPAAARAVGGAIGANPVALLIPCHRVLRSLGAIGGYRWGTARKRAILAREAARFDPRG